MLRKKWALAFLLSLTTFLKGHVFVWDLGQVLVNHSKGQVANLIGFGNLGFKFLTFKATNLLHDPLADFRTHLTNFYLKTLAEVPYVSQALYDIYSEDSITPLPPLLKDFMRGQITSDQAFQICKKWLTHTDYFDKYAYRIKNKVILNPELSIFCKTFIATFDPQVFVNVQYTLPATELLQKCAQECDPKGNKQNICIILSNWATECVAPFKKKFHSEICQYIDAYVFSCDGYEAKPYPTIYHRLYDVVKKEFPYQLNQKWFFIDDQEPNRMGFEDTLVQKLSKKQIFSAHPDHAAKLFKKECPSIFLKPLTINNRATELTIPRLNLQVGA